MKHGKLLLTSLSVLAFVSCNEADYGVGGSKAPKCWTSGMPTDRGNGCIMTIHYSKPCGSVDKAPVDTVYAPSCGGSND